MKFAALIILLSAPAFSWEASSPHDEQPDGGGLGNTHLFIVDRALELLRENGDETSRRAVSELESCRSALENGIADADALPGFEDSLNLGAHFYDPRPDDDCHTFRFFGCRQSHGNARVNAQLQLTHVREGKSPVSPGAYGFHEGSRCYALGLALHFMTDVTMPFHTRGVSGAQVPVMLHPVFESLVPRFQKRFVARRWEPPPTWMRPDDALVAAAFDAKSFLSRLLSALRQARGLCAYSPVPGTAYFGACFRDDARSTEVTGEVLLAAQRHTADWLYALFRDEPKLHLAP